MEDKNKKYIFRPNKIRIELDHFLFKNRDLKKQALGVQLSKAVEAGVISYTDLVRYRDFAAKKKNENPNSHVTSDAKSLADHA